MANLDQSHHIREFNRIRKFPIGMSARRVSAAKISCWQKTFAKKGRLSVSVSTSFARMMAFHGCNEIERPMPSPSGTPGALRLSGLGSQGCDAAAPSTTGLRLSIDGMRVSCRLRHKGLTLVWYSQGVPHSLSLSLSRPIERPTDSRSLVPSAIENSTLQAVRVAHCNVLFTNICMAGHVYCFCTMRSRVPLYGTAFSLMILADSFLSANPAADLATNDFSAKVKKVHSALSHAALHDSNDAIGEPRGSDPPAQFLSSFQPRASRGISKNVPLRFPRRHIHPYRERVECTIFCTPNSAQGRMSLTLWTGGA